MTEGIFIPFVFLKDKNISSFDALVLAYIKSTADENMISSKNDAEIASDLNCNPASIPNVINRLYTLGYIDKYFEDQKRHLVYTYDAPHRGSQSGFIYIMRDLTHSYLKIGFSKNPTYRESTLQGEKPTIELVKKFKGTMTQEQAVHRILARFRKRGEWFDVTLEQAEAAIKKIIGL